MKFKLIVLVLPVVFYAQHLNHIIIFAKKNNSLVMSKNIMIEAKEKEKESVSGSIYPTLDIGGFYQNKNERTLGVPGEIYSAYGKISFDIYDGGKKSALKEQKVSEYKAATYNTKAFKKSLSLQIVKDFYLVKNIEASIVALKEEKNSLQAQLKRINEFYKADLSTKDNVDKLQAAYDTNTYNLQSLQFQKLLAIKDLELKVGKTIKSFDTSIFVKNKDLKLENSSSIKAMNETKDSLDSLASSLNSNYKPKLNISDTYNIYEYGNTDTTHPEGLDKQNTLMLTVNMRLFDGGSIKNSAKAISLNKKAIDKEIIYLKDEQKMFFSLAKQRIITSELKIKSSKSAWYFSKNAYNTIEEKYRAGIVDNVAFLDALSVKTSAYALYEKSINDLEVAYATYYYYAGTNIEEYIK